MFLKGNHSQNLHRTFSKAISELQLQGNLDVILADAKSKLIIDRIFSLPDLFSIGIAKVIKLDPLSPRTGMTSDCTHYKKVILITRVTASGLQQLIPSVNDKQIYLININMSSWKDELQIIKDSELRRNIKGIRQVSLDFVPFLQRVYELKPVLSQNLNHKISCLTSLMLSFQKFYEFQIVHPKKYHNLDLIYGIKTNLQVKLQILKKHSVQQYRQSNQKIKLIIIDRKQDLLSPLITSFNYGPMIFQMNLGYILDNFLTQGGTKILNQIFDMDFSEVTSTIDKIVLQKIDYRKMNLQLNNFEKAKEIIIKNYNPDATHQEINLHLQTVKATIKYCEKRAPRSVVQQSIVNGVNQDGIKLNSRDIVKEIRKWIKEQSQIDQQKEYFKVCMLALMIYDFWFFDRNQIMAGLTKDQQTRIKPFLDKHQAKHPRLAEKPQDPLKRMHYYRHQSKITKIFQQWEKNPKDQQSYQSIVINKSQRLGEAKYILYIDGPMGYNELSHLRKTINQVSKGADDQARKVSASKYYICCDQLMNDREYMDWLIQS